MIRALSILGLLMAVALPLLDYLVLRPRRAASGGTTPAMRGIERLIHAAFLVAVAGMALSGIAPLAFGERMHGWLLIVHMALAPLFSVCIAAVALLWTAQARLPLDRDAAAESEGESTVQAVTFWLVVAAGFVVILSAMLGMMSWFGSDVQEVLLNVHRISAILLTVAAAWQGCRLLARPRGPQGSPDVVVATPEQRPSAG